MQGTSGERRQRKRRRGRKGRSRSKIISSLINVSVLNIYGGQADKWAQLELDVLNKTSVTLMLVCETRLMNAENPPYIEGYHYTGSNRTGKTGRFASGGVGVLRPSYLEEIWSLRGEDWVASAVLVGSKRLVLISVYVAHLPIEINRKLFTSLSNLIRTKCVHTDCILIGGDFNGHLARLDGKSDYRGELLDQFAIANNLTILNTIDKCFGKFTRGNAVIDYVLCNSNMIEYVTEVKIDETREITTLSDHNLITVRCKVKGGNSDNRHKRFTVLDSGKAADITQMRLQPLLDQGEISYDAFKDNMIQAIDKSSRRLKITKRPILQSKDIKHKVKIRRELNKSWRDARMLGIGEAEARAAYRDAQQQVRRAVERAIEEREKQLFDYVLSGPRGERSKRFWKLVNRAKTQRSKNSVLRGEDGEVITDSQIETHITYIACRVLNAKQDENSNSSIRITEPSGIKVDLEKIKRAMMNVQTKTSTGLDHIPAKLLKNLGEIGLSYMAELFNLILEGKEDYPQDWREGRLSMIEKSNSIRGNLCTYRPITVTPVTYRLFAKIMVLEIRDWMESSGILGEMQCGFRQGRRGEDNLFILTSIIELSRKRDKGLVGAFLDLSQAYDRVERELLWTVLEHMNMPRPWIKILKVIYDTNRVKLKHGDLESKWVTPVTGLKQGCPISPILFMLYISGLEPLLLNSGGGFKVRTKGDFFKVREKNFFKIPALLFADDLVLLAKDRREMEKLLDITTNFGTEMKLEFNPSKSSIVVFSDKDVGDISNLKIQSKVLPVDTSYKYLGITISNSMNYLNKQEDSWKEGSIKALQQMHAQVLWGFNKFEISKIQWKATAVPKLTYANAVIVMSTNLRKCLNKNQNSAGRWALGAAHCMMANEFVEGEMGWSSFEAREAQSKIRYFTRIRNMNDTRWPKAILNMMDLEGVKSRAYTRMLMLQRAFDCENITVEYLEGRPLIGKYNLEVMKQIKRKQDNMWRRGMETKPSLTLYREYKKGRGTAEHLYDNSRGSALLAMARAGMLPTRRHRTHFEQGIDSICMRCGMDEETLRHVIHECNEVYFTQEDTLLRLGFTHEISWRHISSTKRLLESWEKETTMIR